MALMALTDGQSPSTAESTVPGPTSASGQQLKRPVQPTFGVHGTSRGLWCLHTHQHDYSSILSSAESWFAILYHSQRSRLSSQRRPSVLTQGRGLTGVYRSGPEQAKSRVPDRCPREAWAPEPPAVPTHQGHPCRTYQVADLSS